MSPGCSRSRCVDKTTKSTSLGEVRPNVGMEALVIICSRNTNGIMVWVWKLWSSNAFETRTELWFGHGCSGHRMLSKHERNYGLGMDALVIECSRNTNGIMVWVWKLWSSNAFETRTELWFGHGCSGHRMLSKHKRNYGLGMEALVIECSRNTNGIMVWVWKLWSSKALETRTELWFGYGSSGHRMLSKHERNYGLGMEALVIECFRNTNGIMVWVWKLWSSNALETRTELWFGYGSSGHRMLSKHERNYGLGMDALVIECFRNTNGIMVWVWMLWSSNAFETQTELWFGYGSSGHRMLSKHERNYGLGMEALVIECSRNTNGIMVWVWKLWSSNALETRTELWFGYGSSGHRMLSKHERNYGLGMEALVIECSRNMNGIMVWAWMLWSSYALGNSARKAWVFSRSRLDALRSTRCVVAAVLFRPPEDRKCCSSHAGHV